MTTSSHDPRDNRSFFATARAVGFAVGAIFLLVGILGFVPGATTNIDDLAGAGHHSGAELFGIFQVSVLHNIVHLGFGVVGLAAALRPHLVPGYLIVGGVIYGVLTVYGFVIDQSSQANFVPLNTADNWLHLGLTVGMLGLGLALHRASRRTVGRTA